MVSGLVGAGTAIYELIQVYRSETELFGETIRIANPGWGLWLSAVGSLALAVFGDGDLTAQRRVPGSTAPCGLM
jgi:hypothetical protein